MKKSRSKVKNGASSAPVSGSEPSAANAAPASATENSRPIVATASAEPSNGIPTIIEAKIDVGFGNQLYIRGGGGGLSWGAGTPLDCAEPECWKWQCADISEPFEFKLLINDQTWCIGANYTAHPGATMQVIPHFC